MILSNYSVTTEAHSQLPLLSSTAPCFLNSWVVIHCRYNLFLVAAIFLLHCAMEEENSTSEKIKSPFLNPPEEPINKPTTTNMPTQEECEQVQHYASVDARKRLELGVAGEGSNPFVVWTRLNT